MPETMTFDPWSLEVQADPYPHYARLREFAPCTRIPADDAWAVSRYADVKTVTTDYRRFSVAQGLGVRRDHMGGNILVQLDPPGHTKSRRMVQHIFLRRNLKVWEERAREVAEQLVDSLLDAGGPVELKSAFAMPLVLKITTDMMGLPEDPEMLEAYPRWSRRIMEDLDRRAGDPDIADLHGTIAEAQEWFTEFIHKRKLENREAPLDMIDALMLTGEGGHTEEVVTQLALTLLAAGNQNTADSICHAVAMLCEHPDQWALLTEDPEERAAAAYEEVVRYTSPAQAVYRLALEDVELSGTTVPKGDRIMMLWASGNRDERAFPDPDHFDILREKTNAHLGFGMGVHRCLGEPIAQIEGVAALRALASRLDRIEPAGPYERYATSVVRGFWKLPVAVTGR